MTRSTLCHVICNFVPDGMLRSSGKVGLFTAVSARARMFGVLFVGYERHAHSNKWHLHGQGQILIQYSTFSCRTFYNAPTQRI